MILDFSLIAFSYLPILSFLNQIRIKPNLNLHNSYNLYEFLLKVNKSLPMNYDFEFAIDEVTNVNDKGSFHLTSNLKTIPADTQISQSNCRINFEFFYQIKISLDHFLSFAENFFCNFSKLKL